LNCSEDGLLLGRTDGGYEGDDDGGDVRRDLELKELANGVVNATTPHDSLDDRSKIVVHKDDVGSLLATSVPAMSIERPDVGSLECWAIVRTVTRHIDNLAKSAKGFNRYLIFGGRSRKAWR
jgi:hypothetical protein